MVFAIDGSTKQVMSVSRECWHTGIDHDRPRQDHVSVTLHSGIFSYLLLELAEQLAAILAGVAFPPLPIYSHVFRVRLSIWVRFSEASQLNKVTKESIILICSINTLIAVSDFVRISRFKWDQEAFRGISPNDLQVTY